MKLTQKQFDKLVNTLNHRITKLEVHAQWIKWLVCGIFVVNVVGVFI